MEEWLAKRKKETRWIKPQLGGWSSPCAGRRNHTNCGGRCCPELVPPPPPPPPYIPPPRKEPFDPDKWLDGLKLGAEEDFSAEQWLRMRRADIHKAFGKEPPDDPESWKRLTAQKAPPKKGRGGKRPVGGAAPKKNSTKKRPPKKR